MVVYGRSGFWDSGISEKADRSQKGVGGDTSMREQSAAIRRRQSRSALALSLK